MLSPDDVSGCLFSHSSAYPNTFFLGLYFSRECSKGLKKTSAVLNLLLLRGMLECSDHKPVVPVGGCDNVLKSLNPVAHTHLRRDHGSQGNVCVYAN